MKQTVAFLMMLVASSAWGSGFYVGADLSAYSSLDIDAPDPVAAHSVDRNTTSQSEPLGYAASLGYQWQSGWYAEIGGSDISTDAKRTESGQDGDIISHTRTESEYDVSRLTALVGKTFHLAGVVDLYVEGGASSYEEEITTSSVLEEENLSTSASTSTTTASSKFSDDGTTYAVGAGIHAGNDTIRSKIGVRHYGEPDELIATLGVAVLF